MIFDQFIHELILIALAATANKTIVVIAFTVEDLLLECPFYPEKLIFPQNPKEVKRTTIARSKKFYHLENIASSWGKNVDCVNNNSKQSFIAIIAS